MHKSEQNGRPVIAVDIGGTKIINAIFDHDGKIMDSDLCPTQAELGTDKIIDNIFANIEGLLKRNGLEPPGTGAPPQIGGICIACAGGIDTRKGIVATPSPHLPDWGGTHLAEIFKRKFMTETYVINDASAAALGEHRYGAGKNVKNMVLLTLGTGIGGGIIIDGKLYLGAVGGAGELGHMTIDADGPRCSCGNRGCLEMLASGTAIENAMVERLQRGEKSSLTGKFKENEKSITAIEIEAAARGGDKPAQDVIARAAYYLGIGLVNVTNIFNPELIIMGGGMAEMGELIMGPGRKMVKERAFSVNAGAVNIVKAQLGNEAGIYGAAAFALDMISRR